MKKVGIIFLIIGMIINGFSQKKKVIVIDPGHGGTDSGAIGINDILEKNVVLEIAMEMLRLNRNILDNNYEIYLTRYSDTLISLSDRVKLINILHPDLFISLHGNHADNPIASGIEAYISTMNNCHQNMESSAKLASHILKLFNERLGYKTRGVKKANFQVLRQTISTCPGVLIELGFLSNKDEASYLLKKENKSVIALAILMSIKNK